MANFKDRLKKLRIEKGMSKLELAKSVGNNSSPHTIRKYESEGLSVKVNNIIELAKFFNVTTDYLLGLTNTREIDLSDVSSDILLEELKKRVT